MQQTGLVHRTVTAAALRDLLGGGLPVGRGPAYRDLAERFRLLVLDGRLPLQVSLPSERELAASLAVSRTTVAAAYALLREQGHLLSRPGARSTTTVPRHLGSSPTALGLVPPPGVHDLAYASPPAPSPAVHEAYEAALSALPAHLPGTGYDPHGLLALREAVAERYVSRGLPTRPHEVLVTAGAQHAWVLLLRALTDAGDRVLVDAPSYPHALDAVRAACCRAVPVALPATGGWDLPGITAALRQTAPRLAYVIADFHNPTGRLLAAEQRAQLVRAARRSRTVLVVDETLVDLGLDGPAPPPVAVHGREVLTIGSMSKSFWGGLRIGWVRGPAELIARLTAVRTTFDLGSPVVEQLAAAELLARADTVLPARRAQLTGRRDHLLTLLEQHLPDWVAERPAGGLSLWARLPEPLSSAVAAHAPREGVRVAAGPRFGTDGAFEHHLRLPYTLTAVDLDKAVRALARTWRAVHLLPAGTRADIGLGAAVG